MNTCSKNLLKGLLTTLLLLTVIILAPRFTNMMNNGFQIQAEFENTGGLKIHSSVMVNGRVVGKVTDIDYNNDGYTARVAMSFFQRPVLPTDTKASIMLSGLLTEHYIELDPGLDQAYLNSGDLIKLTQPALAFEQVSGQRMHSRVEEEFIGEKNL